MNTLISVAIIVFSLLSAVLFPIATYITTLSTFGLAHVLIELRYIDSRFHAKLPKNFQINLISILLLIAGLRYFSIFGVINLYLAYILELLCGIALIFLATHHLICYSWRWSLLSLIIGILVGIGIIYDPVMTLIFFAIFHNLTPIGFILERKSSFINRLLLLCCLIFLVLPVLIFLFQFLRMNGLTESLDSSYLSAFVPPLWQHLPIAYPLFSAVTFLQCMHYGAVIGLFSQWTKKESQTLINWFPSPYFYGFLGILSIIILIAFQQSFMFTRAIYGIIASLHAWIEIPLLLILPLYGIKQQTKAIRS